MPPPYSALHYSHRHDREGGNVRTVRMEQGNEDAATAPTRYMTARAATRSGASPDRGFITGARGAEGRERSHPKDARF